MRSRILAGFLAVAMSVISFAPALAAGGTNGNLNGTVIDASSKAPIAGASVIARSGSGTYSATTDARGFFSILQMNVDSYTVAITASKYDPQTLQNVIVFGDETDTVGTVAMQLSNAPKTIVKVTSRAQNSAYQPTQTTDTYSVSGQRIQQALGNQYSTNEAALVQSAPGVIQTYDPTLGSGLSIRGSLSVELGYQYDEVPFSSPFFNANASQGFINGINGGSGGGLQIVSGAGDATQGNVGGGVINTIVPRGVYPGFADAVFQAGGPYFNHILNGDWSTGSPNGRFSNYMSIAEQSDVPQNIPWGVPAASVGAVTGGTGVYYGVGYERRSDFVDNMVLRFGRNNNQSFQALVRVAFLQQFAGYGGLQGLSYFQNNPGFLGFFACNFTGCPGEGGNPGAGDLATMQSLIPTLPYQPANLNAPISQGENVTNNPLHFLKFAYTNSINSTTFASLSIYNWGLLQGGTNYENFNATGFNSGYNGTGGSRTGGIFQLTHQFGENNTLTAEAKYEVARPYWDGQTPALGLLSMIGDSGNGPDSPNASMWQTPVGGVCPSSTATGGCYIYNYLNANGLYTGTMPQVPTFGISYQSTIQQMVGVGLRDQWQIGDKLNLDFGIRVDDENNKFSPAQLAAPGGTPSDVDPSLVGSGFTTPRETEPRFSASYRLTKNDSLRFSYGRSTLFFFGQTLGTPIYTYGINPLLFKIPAWSNSTSGNPNVAAGTNEAYCGSGTHGPGTGYSLNNNISGSFQGAAANGVPVGYFFPCASLADEIGWFYDQNWDAPDLGGNGPPTYSNFDLAWSHLFTKGALRGWSSRITGYTRRGFNVEQNNLLSAGPPNPITGQTSAAVFATQANGVEKTTGIEAQLTTPDVPKGQSGFSGFVTFDYINELLTTPPVAGSAGLPILNGFLLESGQLFHAGFVPPVSAVIGATYHFKNGMTLTPTIFANGGYPFGVGQNSLGYVNGLLLTVPQNNFGVGLPYAGVSQPGQVYNASYYVDPTVPGSTLNPNISASRGYAEPVLAGQKTSPAQVFLNLDFEAPVGKDSVVGIQAYNLNNYKWGVPTTNTIYQPVAYGIAGPLTGQVAPGLGTANEDPASGGLGPYLNGLNVGTTWNVYFRTRL